MFEVLETIGMSGPLSYLIFFALLVATGLGSPIPEDVLLIAAGLLTAVDALTWPFVVVTAMVGVMMSDVFVYALGRRIAWPGTHERKPKFLSAKRIRRATDWFDRLGLGTIVLARLVPGTRALVLAVAGARGVSFGQFVAMDALGAAIWVPLMLLTGRYLGRTPERLDIVMTFLADAGTWLALVMVLLTVLWVQWGREESKL